LLAFTAHEFNPTTGPASGATFTGRWTFDCHRGAWFVVPDFWRQRPAAAFSNQRPMMAITTSNSIKANAVLQKI
jgi:hypothetical protein